MTVNFRIVENESSEHLFESFLEDYKKGHSITKLREKYGITRGVWKSWRERMPLRKEAYNHRPRRERRRAKNLAESYVDDAKNGCTVCRRIKGKRYSYGTYPSRKVAEMIHDELKQCDWDKEVAYELLHTYAIPNSKRTLSAKLLRRDF